MGRHSPLVSSNNQLPSPTINHTQQLSSIEPNSIQSSLSAAAINLQKITTPVSSQNIATTNDATAISNTTLKISYEKQSNNRIAQLQEEAPGRRSR